MTLAIIAGLWLLGALVALGALFLLKEQGETIKDLREANRRLYADYQAAITALCAKNGERVILPTIYASAKPAPVNLPTEPLAPAWTSKSTEPTFKTGTKIG